MVDKWIVVKLGMKYVVYRKGDGRFYNYLRIDTTKKDKVITGKVIVIDGGTFPIALVNGISLSLRWINFGFIKKRRNLL
ncbi:hypothetical protein ACXYMX_11055 [Sporosarcina sp. CAU 1771]